MGVRLQWALGQSNTVIAFRSFHCDPDKIFGVVRPLYSSTRWGESFSTVKNSGSIKAAMIGLVASILINRTDRVPVCGSESFLNVNPTVSLLGTTMYRHLTSLPRISSSQCCARKGPTISLTSVSFRNGSLSTFGLDFDEALFEYSNRIWLFSGRRRSHPTSARPEAPICNSSNSYEERLSPLYVNRSRAASYPSG